MCLAWPKALAKPGPSGHGKLQPNAYARTVASHRLKKAMSGSSETEIIIPAKGVMGCHASPM